MPTPNLIDQPVLMLYVGGTIGMVETTRGLAPGSDFSRRLSTALARLPASRQAKLPDLVIRESAHPIDSSSATPADWQRLGSEIAAALPQHAGVVVLHGTDTLAWSASSLAFQLQGVDRPVVVTGAMRPLGSEGSDALDNVELALQFAARPALQEVAVAFGNRLLRGARSRKVAGREAFVSPHHPPLGERIDGEAMLFPAHGLAIQQGKTPHFELADYAGLAEGGVVRIVLWPGIQAWQVAAWLEDRRVRGALLEVWGGGNAPDDPCLLAAFARARSEGKLLAAVSQCPAGGVTLGRYAAGMGLAEAGVLSGDTMTPEAAYTKLVHLLALPLDDDERRRRFLASLAGER
ncbi:asparaginase [Billgrantia gudaonensis]|uniref:L-asparaginase n=1 Tax=Billgrantia gudaonensis TaxID=376427 RepID=A0A1G8X1E8_9GAMM|nr:asparaginase [Halomonas gudaonensis]SDJ84146.1 L-asparaginase [Halomonas gudaonensis]